MYNIKLLNKISPAGLALLDGKKYLCGDDVSNPDAILLRSASMHDMEITENVRAVARAGAGVNNIPVDRCTAQGIVVFNTPGANANAVKELTVAGLLLSARKIYPSMRWVQELKGRGEEVPALVEKGKGKFSGPELSGKKLGVIGLGAIGVMVCNVATQLDMEVYGYDPYLTVEGAWGLSRAVLHATSLRQIYEQCDFITLHLPLNAETKGMINSQSIAGMKHGVRIINFSRGELVEEEDILAALDEKQVYCYITDFPTDNLLGHPGVLALPHLGASTPESEENCARMVARQLRDFLENGNIQNAVNLPNLYMERTANSRITVFHRNIPAMISKVTGVMGMGDGNIDNMTNKSRGDLAYTVMDVDRIPSDAVEKLKGIEGVIRVTVLK